MCKLSTFRDCTAEKPVLTAFRSYTHKVSDCFAAIMKKKILIGSQSIIIKITLFFIQRTVFIPLIFQFVRNILNI